MPILLIVLLTLCKTKILIVKTTLSIFKKHYHIVKITLSIGLVFAILQTKSL